MKLPEGSRDRRDFLLRIFWLLILLFAFLVAIQVMGSTFKLMGKGHAQGLFGGIRNPFLALSVGILATVLVQSSSMTTSLVVTVVSSGQLGMDMAVFTILGCNIGTTVTNTLVSLGHLRHDQEFRRAFAGATMHDFFNILALLVFMPLELLTGILRNSAAWLSGLVYGAVEGGDFNSPIKAVVKFLSKGVEDFFLETLGLPTGVAGPILLVLALGVLFFSLIHVTRNMKALMADRMEKQLNDLLGKSGVLAIFLGVVMTVSVQSSSITTALMIPLFAAGILSLENGFPVTLGANIGTTVTALFAALAAKEAGLTIALVHLLFNTFATLLFYPIPQIRHLPVRLARRLADLTMESKAYAVLYVLIVFLGIPLVGTLIFK